MENNNYMELDNVTLVEWVGQAFNHSFTHKTLNIWPYNCKAKDNGNQPSNIYKQHNNEGGEDDYTSYEQYDKNINVKMNQLL